MTSSTKNRTDEFTTFRHFRSLRANIADLTVCVRRFGESNPTHMSVSWAICSTEDQFCRATGREIAQHNMDIGRYVVHKIDPDKTMALNTIEALYDGRISSINERSAVDAGSLVELHTKEMTNYRSQAIRALENVAFIEATLQHQDGKGVDDPSEASILDNVLCRVVANELAHRGIEAAKLISAV